MSQITIPQAENVSVADLKTDQQNPNKMSKEQHERLSASIKKWGFIVPIITNKDLLIADGEQRWTVAKALGMTQVSVIRLPVEDVDRRLLRQVLNKLRGEHELLLDAEEFDKIIELGKKDDLKYLLDLTDKDLAKYLTELNPAKEDDYDVPEIEGIETDIEYGSIIQLGKHRLMCWDATDKDKVKELTEYSTLDLLLTDPPYGINVVSRRKQIGGGKVPTFAKTVGFDGIVGANSYIPIVGDDKPFEPAHLIGLTKTLMIFGANYFADKLPSSAGWFVWDKEGGKDWDDTFADCEFIYTNLKHHAKIYRVLWKGMVKEGESGKRVHPTQKPIKLLADLINDFTEANQTVLDLYGGSGSTLIACEQTGRTCYMMEIDPRYCEIICQRWEKYTGQKRVKLVTSGKNNV
jgi:16S rRNA G966 N2-methylase RsmD